MRSDTLGIGLGRGVGGGGDDDDIVTQTPPDNLQKSHSTLYLQYFRDVGPSYIVTKPTSGLCELDLGISDGFLRKIELGWGEACFGDDDDIVSRTPRTISSHPSAHTPQLGVAALTVTTI